MFRYYRELYKENSSLLEQEFLKSDIVIPFPSLSLLGNEGSLSR